MLTIRNGSAVLTFDLDPILTRFLGGAEAVPAAPKERSVRQPKADTKPQPKAEKPARQPKAARKAPKPKASGRPKCSIHTDRFLSNSGVCYSCNPELNKWAKPTEQPAAQPKAEDKPAPTKSAGRRRTAKPSDAKVITDAAASEKPVKPTKSAGKTAKAQQVTQSVTRQARPTKSVAKAASKPSASKPEGLPENISEADLVLHWSRLMTEGHRDIVEACLNVSKRQFESAKADGDRFNAMIFGKRVLNLKNVLS